MFLIAPRVAVRTQDIKYHSPAIKVVSLLLMFRSYTVRWNSVISENAKTFVCGTQLKK